MKASTPEFSQLQRYEVVLEKCRTPFVETGLALGAICSQRLYREECASFEARLREEWTCSRHTGVRPALQLGQIIGCQKKASVRFRQAERLLSDSVQDI